MTQIVLDLSGKDGLVPNFQGDLNDTTAQPQLRYVGGDSQMADGIYDPLRNSGYLSPSNNTYAALSGTITNEFIAASYSSTQDTLYLAQNGVKLSTVSGLDGSTMTSTSTLASTSNFRDIDIYEMNDNEALLYSYLSVPTSGTVSNLALGFTSTDSSKGAFQLAAKVFETLPVASTAGILITSAANQQLAQKFTTTDFVTVTSLPVSGIRLRLQMPYSGSTQIWTLKASIQTDSAGSPSGTDVVGATATVNPANLPQGDFGYVYFTFAAAVTLSATSTYHIVLQPTLFSDLGANEGVSWLCSSGNNSLYTDGAAEKYDGTTWNQASVFAESFDFALICNAYTHLGESSTTLYTDNGYVTIGASGGNYVTASSSTSFSLTSTANINPCVAVIIRTTGTPSAVTCDAVAMTQQATYSQLGFVFYIYTKVGVVAGSHTIAITTTGSANTLISGIMYYGVDQTTPAAGFTGANGQPGTGNFTFSVSAPWGRAGSVPLAIATLSAAVTLTANNGTVRGSTGDTRATLVDANAYQTASSGSYSFGFTESSGNTPWAAFFGSIQPAAITSTTLVAEPPIVEGNDASVFLCKADNGFIYWFTNNRVHKFDGGVSGGDFGNLTPDVLNFPSFIICADAIDTSSLMYIGLQSSPYSGEETKSFSADTCGLYVWDRTAAASAPRNFIPAPSARQIKKIFVTAEGEIRVITIGSDKFTEVRGISNGKLVVLARLGLNAYPVYRDSLSLSNNMAYWLGADGIIYAFGRAYLGAQEAVYKMGDMTANVGGGKTLTSGLLIAGNKDASKSTDGFFVSFKDTTPQNKLLKWYPHGTGTINSVAQLGHVGSIYSKLAYLPKLSTLSYIDIYCLPITTSDATTVATLSFYANQSTTAFMTKTITRTDIAKGYLHYEINKAYVNAVQVKVAYSTSQTLGVNDFQPSYAILSYEPTSTKR